jgi:hypothetical protein
MKDLETLASLDEMSLDDRIDCMAEICKRMRIETYSLQQYRSRGLPASYAFKPIIKKIIRKYER